MNPVTGLSVGRIAVGVTALARPDLAARTLRLDTASNPQLGYVTRLFGSREVALGVVTLLTRGRRAQQGVIGLGVLVDAADVATGYLAARDGSISRKAAMALVGPAVGAIGSGVVGLLRR